MGKNAAELIVSCTNLVFSHNYNDTIFVLVGAEEQCFTVHKDVICVKSKFFKAACSDRWTKFVRLPSVEPGVFQRYLDWAYGDVVVSQATLQDNLEMSVKLYLLGDTLEDVRLRNKVLRALNSYSSIDKLQPGPKSHRLIWDSTPPSSPLRRWAIDAAILRVRRENFERNLSSYPMGFVRQVALKKLMQQKPTVAVKTFQAKLPEYIEVEDESL